MTMWGLPQEFKSQHNIPKSECNSPFWQIKSWAVEPRKLRKVKRYTLDILGACDTSLHNSKGVIYTVVIVFYMNDILRTVKCSGIANV